MGLGTRLGAQFNGASIETPRLTGTYFGTEADLGFMLEIAHVPPGFAMPEPEYTYPPASEPPASASVDTATATA